jgi:hypothetical protein
MIFALGTADQPQNLEKLRITRRGRTREQFPGVPGLPSGDMVESTDQIGTGVNNYCGSGDGLSPYVR